VTGGNVSLYNETGEPGSIDSAIHPTPVVGVLGVHDDVTRVLPSGWPAEGLDIALLGTTRPELGGSAWADVVHGHLGGLPPAVDLEAERALAEFLVTGAREGVLAAAHDLSEGGLAQALVEACLRFDVGADVDLTEAVIMGDIDVFELLFSESGGRALVAVPRGKGATQGNAAARVESLATSLGVPLVWIGYTGVWTGVAYGTDVPKIPTLCFRHMFDLPLPKAREAFERTLPARFAD
jgi:phosphoribosylformylglycinamidine synthase